jgi:hypothetical protein
LKIPQFYTGCPAFGFDYESTTPQGVTLGTAAAWTNVFMNETILLNGNALSPTTYTCGGGFCSNGAQVAPGSNYVSGVNTMTVNHTHPGNADGPALNITCTNQFLLDCTP